MSVNPTPLSLLSPVTPVIPIPLLLLIHFLACDLFFECLSVYKKFSSPHMRNSTGNRRILNPLGVNKNSSNGLEYQTTKIFRQPEDKEFSNNYTKNPTDDRSIYNFQDVKKASIHFFMLSMVFRFRCDVRSHLMLP